MRAVAANMTAIKCLHVVSRRTPLAASFVTMPPPQSADQAEVSEPLFRLGEVGIVALVLLGVAKTQPFLERFEI